MSDEGRGLTRGGIAALLADEARAGLCWASYGILCGHVWIWEAAHRTGELFPGMGQSVIIYLALSAMMIALTALALGVRPARRAFAALDWPMAAVLAVGTALICAPVSLPMATSTRVALGSALGGLGMASAYLQWAHYYGSLGTREIIACIFGAMALGSLLKIPLDVAPAWASCVVCASLGFVSSALVRVAERSLRDARGASSEGRDAEPADGVVEGAPRGAEAASGAAYERAGGRAGSEPVRESVPGPDVRGSWAAFRSVVRSVGRTFAGVIAYGLVIGMMQGMDIPADPVPKWLLSCVHHGLEVAFALGVLWYVLGTRKGLHFGNVWTVVMMATGAGVMLLPLVGAGLAGWALIAVAVAQTLVVMLLWAMLGDVAHHHRSEVSPVAVFGVGWTVYSLSFPVGHWLGYALSAGSGSSTSVIGLIVYVLALSTVLFLRESDFSQNRIFGDLEAAPLPPSMGDVIERACRRVGARHGLTDREVQVMRMICVGRSKGYIAESLSISENTVRSHARHLYSKLGAHSKQDLLDIVQAEAAER